MSANYITRAQLLLQYYSALEELDRESLKRAAEARAEAARDSRQLARMPQLMLANQEVRVSA